MKAIRTFNITDSVLTQRTLMSALFDPDSEDLDNDLVIDMSIRVAPDALSPLHLYTDAVTRDDYQFIVTAPNDCGLDILIDEIQHFINVLKTMYYGS